MSIFTVLSGGNESRDVSDKRFNEMENSEYSKATFAGGCFWCIEFAFDNINGVKEVINGYTGGKKENPTYNEVSTGKTGHYEAVRIYYDPNETAYEELLEVFWRQIDPTDPNGQFADRGPQYRTAIFYHNQEQENLARKSKKELNESDKFDDPVVTKILPIKDFYPAEDHHQNYYEKNPVKFHSYEKASGREDFKKEKWESESIMKDSNSNNTWENFEKPSKEKLKEQLTSLQFKVTQKDGTEPPNDNKYYDNKEEGIYVDIVSGEPLFSSKSKYKSGSGWPSFFKPLEPENIVKKTDKSLLNDRIEVRSKYADSHLGHVFDDGPEPTGKRYCINSAALKFIPKDELEEEGYEEYKNLFESKN